MIIKESLGKCCVHILLDMTKYIRLQNLFLQPDYIVVLIFLYITLSLEFPGVKVPFSV